MNRLFSSNIAVRILSLVIALVIWVVASDQFITQSTGQEMSKNFYRIPIEVVSEPKGHSISYDHSAIESLVLKGNAALLSSMLGQEITAKIDLEGYSEGEFDVPIQLSYPAGLSLVALQPARVHVKLVSSVSRVMDLEVRVLPENEIEDRVPQVSYRPETIMLDGPRQLVEEVHKVIVNVDLSLLQEGVEKAYDVLAVNKEGEEIEGLSLQPSLVSLSVNYLPVKELPLLYPEGLEIPEGYVVESYAFEPSHLRVYGSQEELDKSSALQAFVEQIILSSEDEGLEELIYTLAGQVFLAENSKLQILGDENIILTVILSKVE